MRNANRIKHQVFYVNQRDLQNLKQVYYIWIIKSLYETLYHFIINADIYTMY